MPLYNEEGEKVFESFSDCVEKLSSQEKNTKEDARNICGSLNENEPKSEKKE